MVLALPGTGHGPFPFTVRLSTPFFPWLHMLCFFQHVFTGCCFLLPCLATLAGQYLTPITHDHGTDSVASGVLLLLMSLGLLGSLCHSPQLLLSVCFCVCEGFLLPFKCPTEEA